MAESTWEKEGFMVNIGRILRTIRKEQGIGQGILCRGLCYKATYSRFERGERIPDRLSFNALMQRLGKDAGKVTLVMNEEEYQYFLWRRQTAQAAVREDVTGLQELLLRPEGVVSSKYGCQSLQRQFLFCMNAVIADKTGHSIQETITWLLQAVEATLPDFSVERMEGYLISVSEINVLADLAEAMLRAGERKEARRLLEAIHDYGTNHYKDRDARAKILPRTARLLAPVLIEDGEYFACMENCRNAIDLLCSLGILYDLPQLMEAYLKASAHGFYTPVAGHYEKQLAALRELYREYQVDPDQMQGTAYHYQNQELYLIGEVIRQARRHKGLSQEETSEDICSPENFSRLENGQHAPGPVTFRAIMERLDTDLDYFEMGIDTSNILLLEKKRAFDLALFRLKFEEAGELLAQIREGLLEEGTLEQSRNRQILMVEEGVLHFYKKDLDETTFLQQCAEYFGCQQEAWLSENFWDQFLTKHKAHTLNILALIYTLSHKEYDKGIYLWEHILRWMENSRMPVEARFSSSMTAISNLSTFYGTVERHEDCIKICEKGIRLALSGGKGMKLGKYVMNRTESRMDMGAAESADSRSHIQQAFYLSDLFGMKNSTTYADGYYRRKFDPDVKWYQEQSTSPLTSPS